MNFEELYRKIMDSEYIVNDYEFSCIVDNYKAREKIAEIIKSWCLSCDLCLMEQKIAMLEAKIRVYEEIISKSNFKPLLNEEEI